MCFDVQLSDSTVVFSVFPDVGLSHLHLCSQVVDRKELELEPQRRPIQPGIPGRNVEDEYLNGHCCQQKPGVPWMVVVPSSDKPGKSGVEVLDERDTDLYPSDNSGCGIRRYPTYFYMYADGHMVWAG